MDQPRTLDLSDADEAAVLRGCPLPTDGVPPGGEPEVLTALQDVHGVIVLLATRTWLQTCPVPVGPDGTADFDRVPPGGGQAARTPGEYVDLPDVPVVSFG
nr:hypothetical protein [Micromonospora sp. DSM 115978]